MSFSESLDVHSGDLIAGTGGLELYDVYPQSRWPAIEPLRHPVLDTHRFRIHWKRGLVGATLVTTTVGIGILEPESFVVLRVASVLGG